MFADPGRRFLQEEKQIPYSYIEVNPYNKPQSLLDLNPRGLVPTLQYDNKPLYESTVICEFLEDVYSDHRPRLLPQDPYDRARTRIWTDYCTSRIIPAFHRFLQFQPASDEQGLKEVRDDFLGKFKEFTKEMDGTGPFFLGKEPSLIDFVVAPWVMRLWVFDHFKGGSGIPTTGHGGADEKTWDRLKQWQQALEERPASRTPSLTSRFGQLALGLVDGVSLVDGQIVFLRRHGACHDDVHQDGVPTTTLGVACRSECERNCIDLTFDGTDGGMSVSSLNPGVK